MRRIGMAVGAMGLVFGLGNPADAGLLTGANSQGQVLNRNLTTEGSLDWAVWGIGSNTSLVQNVSKSGGSALSDLTNISNGNPLRGLGQFGNFGESSFSWSNGSPTANGSGVFTGLQHNGQGTSSPSLNEGFSFTADATTSERILTLYTIVHLGVGTLKATLSDGSAAALTVTSSGIGNNVPNIFTIHYAANSPGQTLNVAFILTTNGSPDNAANVAIQGASLSQVPDAAVPTPEPSTLAGASIAVLAVLAYARRRPRVA